MFSRLTFYISAYVNSSLSTIASRRNAGISYSTNSISCICYSAAGLTAYKKRCNWYIICSIFPRLIWIKSCSTIAI